MRTRPIAISVIAAFLFAATLVSAIVGTSLLIPGTFLDRIWEVNKPAYAGFEALGRASGLLLLLLGIYTAFAGAGLIKGRKWGRWLAIALFVVNGVGDVVNLLRTRDWLKSGAGVLIAATFLFCLFRSRATAFFESQRDI